jgi:hypothetical protein
MNHRINPAGGPRAAVRDQWGSAEGGVREPGDDRRLVRDGLVRDRAGADARRAGRIRSTHPGILHFRVSRRAGRAISPTGRRRLVVGDFVRFFSKRSRGPQPSNRSRRGLNAVLLVTVLAAAWIWRFFYLSWPERFATADGVEHAERCVAWQRRRWLAARFSARFVRRLRDLYGCANFAAGLV